MLCRISLISPHLLFGMLSRVVDRQNKYGKVDRSIQYSSVELGQLPGESSEAKVEMPDIYVKKSFFRTQLV